MMPDIILWALESISGKFCFWCHYWGWRNEIFFPWENDKVNFGLWWWKKIEYVDKAYFIFHLVTPLSTKLAFDQKNTRKNPDEKQTTPISDPKKLLKPKGYIKQTSASVGKMYLLALRVTLRLQEDKPSTHQNICGLKGCEWVTQRDFKERKDSGDHCRSMMGHWAMES